MTFTINLRVGVDLLFKLNEALIEAISLDLVLKLNEALSEES